MWPPFVVTVRVTSVTAAATSAAWTVARAVMAMSWPITCIGMVPIEPPADGGAASAADRLDGAARAPAGTVVDGAISGIAAAPDWVMLDAASSSSPPVHAARPSAVRAAMAMPVVATRRRRTVAVMSCVLPMAMRRSARGAGSRARMEPMAHERDILDDFADRRRPIAYPEVEVAPGMVVEDRSSGFCGDVVTWSIEAVTLRDRHQHRRHFAWKPGGFLLEGRPVTLRRPAVVRSSAPAITASGSVAGRTAPAKVAVAARIWVEGRHDAEL